MNLALVLFLFGTPTLDPRLSPTSMSQVEGRVLNAGLHQPVAEVPVRIISVTGDTQTVYSDKSGNFTATLKGPPKSVSIDDPRYLQMIRFPPMTQMKHWRVKDLVVTEKSANAETYHRIDLQGLPLREPNYFYIEDAFYLVNTKPQMFTIRVFPHHRYPFKEFLHILKRKGDRWVLHKENLPIQDNTIQLVGSQGTYLLVSRIFREVKQKTFEPYNHAGFDIDLKETYNMSNGGFSVVLQHKINSPTTTLINISEVIQTGKNARRGIAYTHDFFGLSSAPTFYIDPYYSGQNGWLHLSSVSPEKKPGTNLEIPMVLENLLLTIYVPHPPSPVIDAGLLPADSPKPPLPEGTQLLQSFSLAAEGLFPGDLFLRSYGKKLSGDGKEKGSNWTDKNVRGMLLRYSKKYGWEFVAFLKGRNMIEARIPVERINQSGIYAVVEVPDTYKVVKGSIFNNENPAHSARVYIKDFPWHGCATQDGSFLLPVTPSADQPLTVKYRDKTHEVPYNSAPILLQQ